MQKTRLTNILFVLFLTLIVMGGAIMVFVSWPFTTDDAYISLRYAANWYFHHQLTWNVGADPIEGYSNFLYVVFGYLAYSLHLNPMLLLKCIGVFSIILSASFTYFFARLWLERLYALFPVMLLSSNVGFYYWGVSGLEVIFFQASFLGAVYFFLKALNSQGLSTRTPVVFFLLSFFFCILSALSRFDGLIAMITVFLIALAHCLSGSSKSKNTNVVFLIVYFLMFAVFYAVYFCWRFHYFGSWMPNSYACKTHVFQKLTPHIQSWVVFKEFLSENGIFYLFAFFFCWKKRASSAWVVFLVSTVYLLLFYHVDLVLNYFNHYMLPVLPFIFVFGVAGMLLGLRSISVLDKKITFWAVVIFFAFYVVLSVLIRAPVAHYFAAAYFDRDKVRENMALELSHHLKKHDSVLLGDAGIVSLVLLEHPVMDMFCLNSSCYTKQCAHAQHYKSCVRNYFFSKEPRFIIFNSMHSDALLGSHYYLEDLLEQHVMASKKYKLFKEYTVASDQYSYFVFKRS